MKIEVKTKDRTVVVRALTNPISLFAVLDAAGVKAIDFDAVEVDGIRVGGFSLSDQQAKDERLKMFSVRCTDTTSSVRLLRRCRV